MPSEPQPTELLWPDAERGPWRLRVWWRVQHGVPTPVGISLTSWIEHSDLEKPGPHNRLPFADDDAKLPAISGQLLRSLPVGTLLDELREQQRLALTQERDESAMPEVWRESWRNWRKGSAVEREAYSSTRRGRDLGDDHYREAAEVYAQAVQDGRNPTQAVAEHFTIAKSSAAKKVARARERGYLPKTTRGRIGPLTEEL